jgi:hypothetical protein
MVAMFRDDREAMVQKLDVLDREAEELRADNAAMREQILASQRAGSVQQATALDPYRIDIAYLDSGTQAALRHHQLTPFPVWLVAVLNVLTLGIFPLIHFGLQHDRLPRALANDPTGGKAIGFAFIPYFNLYWVFFNSLRLADRLNLQFRLRGMPDGVPRNLVLATAIMSVIPYVNLLITLPIMWTITACSYQSAINRLAASP